MRIEIVGSGPVSFACALFLVRAGVPATAIGLDTGERAIAPGLGERALAMGLGTWQLLGRIADPPSPAATIVDVEVSLRGTAGRTRIRSRDMRVQSLGSVVRYRDLMSTLRAACARQTFAQPAMPHDAIVIHAEGDTGTAPSVRDFGQWALLADLRTALPDDGVAHERFTDEGPLALLPLPSAGGRTIVWCGSQADTERRRTLDAQAFARELEERLALPISPLVEIGARRVAPLVRRMREVVVERRAVWIGNAAQALHPVAGQGLNLGIRDAFELARCLASVQDRDDRIDAALDAYARSRAGDRRAMVGITDALARIFTLTPLRPLQSVALGALDLAGPLRGALASRLMYGRR